MSKNTVSARRWLLLPMEIKVREFESRVLLACIAAERGYGVFLGRNGFNTDGKYPQGVYFDKCISPNKKDNLENQVKGLGNKLATLDVEGLVYQSEEKWLRIRISQETVDLSSLICTWGREQHDMINRAFDIPEKLAITGAPTADLWQSKMNFLYQERVDDLKARFGDFILIPSNFSMVINANGADFFLKHFIQNGFVKTEEEIKVLKESLVFHQKVFDQFLKMIPAIAEDNPDHTVILRPHPGDDNAFWKEQSKSWPDNIKVLYEGTISPWILAAKMLVHNSCSTGVEAFARGKPTIAYTPYTHDKFDQNIPNPLSQQADSIEEVLDLVKANLEQTGLGRTSEKLALYKQHIEESDERLAGDLIVDSIDQLDLPKATYQLPDYNLMKKLRITARQLKRRFRDLTGSNKFTYAYRKQKNPGVSLDEVNALLSDYQKHLGRFEHVQVKQVEEDAFCFFKAV